MADKKENALLVMRTVNTEEDTLTHVVLWACALIIAFFAWLGEKPLMLLYLSAPFVLASMIFAFYKASKRVIVTEDYIETQCFLLFRRKLKWQDLRAYRLKHIRGYYYLDSKNIVANRSRHINDKYILLLYSDKRFPMRIRHTLTGFKQLKGMLKDRNIKRLKMVTKDPRFY